MLPILSNDGRPNALLRTEDLASFCPRFPCRFATPMNINRQSRRRRLQATQLRPPTQFFSNFDTGRKRHTIEGSYQFAVEARLPTLRDTNSRREHIALVRVV